MDLRFFSRPSTFLRAALSLSMGRAAGPPHGSVVPPPEPPCTVSVLTPRGQGGIGVIRLAGTEARTTLERVFRSPRGRHLGDCPPGGLMHGFVEHEGQRLDEVLICRREGASIFEINCHGGIVPLERIVAALRQEGAQAAPATVDLRLGDMLPDAVQREALALLPDALTVAAAQMLLRQANGALSRSLRQAAGEVEQAAAGGVTPGPACARQLEELLATARWGRALCAPLRLVIAGRPNVGKSTLFNALLAEDRALTHERAGTTRDWVEALVVVRDVPFRLVDTAGIRSAGDQVEMLGVERSRAQLGAGDLLLLVLDGSAPLTTDDRQLAAAAGGAAVLPVINKTDLPSVLSAAEVARQFGVAPVRVSARQGDGLPDLEERIIAALFGAPQEGREAVVFTRRQEERVGAALLTLRRAGEDEEGRAPLLWHAATQLRDCLR